jgi:alpha-galactosidase
MMCSGGGGRVDYEAMKYSHAFWPSDMTDPERRIFIQWGYSFFFPAIATANHVTLAGGHSLKFAFEVAMSGRLGMDVDLEKLHPADRQIAKRAIALYKGIREVVQFGEQYRLESPYDGPRSSLMYVKNGRAILFVYSLGEAGAAELSLKGLDPKLTYHVSELDASAAPLSTENVYSGRSLLTEGLQIPALSKFQSAVYELIEE